MNPVRIAIADDDAGMRLVFSKLIERAEGFEKVGEAENGLKMVELFQKEKPQVVVLDVEMPEMDGIACARSIQDMCPTTVINPTARGRCASPPNFFASSTGINPFRKSHRNASSPHDFPTVL